MPSYVELAALVTQLRTRVAQLEETVATREARIIELEKLLEQSRRENKRQAAPFSKGGPKDESARPGRKSGKLHGRHGHRMAPTRVDRELDAPAPEVCPHCGGQTDLEEIAEQFQTELPDPQPVVTKFRVHIRRCRDCGRRLQGRHLEQTSDALGAAAAQIGPHLKGLAELLHYGMGLSFGRIAQLMGRWGVPITAGALCQAAQKIGAALEPTTDAIKTSLAVADQVTMDESGWRINARSAWLWVATSTMVTLFVIAEGRGFEEACLLLTPDYHGVLVRDGWGPYRSYTDATHQSCIGHLLRRCHEMVLDLPGWARSTPRRVGGLLHEALDARDLPPPQRQAALADIDERIDLLLEEPQPHEANRKLVKHLANERSALLTFLERPGVDATNWRGEQAIRPGVVNRKTSGGNRSDRGAETQGRIMSLLRTAHQQGADAVALIAELARAPTPIVLPLAYSGVNL